MNREENAEDAKATVTVTREPPGGRSFIRHDARHLMLPVGPSVNFHTFKERGDLSHESPGSRSVLGVCRHHARRPHMVLAGGRPRPGRGAGQMGGGGGRCLPWRPDAWGGRPEGRLGFCKQIPGACSMPSSPARDPGPQGVGPKAPRESRVAGPTQQGWWVRPGGWVSPGGWGRVGPSGRGR